jgi:hypothetical protein
MATTRNSDRIRYRYGICLNDNCEKCKSKEVQEVPARKDFVCQNPECGKPLRECPPPKKGGNTKLIAIIAGVVAVLAIIGGIIALSGGGESKPEPVEATAAPVDSDSIKAAQMEAENQRLKDSLAAVAAAADAQKKEADKKPVADPSPAPKPAGGSKNLGYATFKGSWPNDVNGRMVFKTSHVIDSKDPKGRVAEAGDYVIGEWSDGHLVQGIWYGADNQVKGSVIIGK